MRVCACLPSWRGVVMTPRAVEPGQRPARELYGAFENRPCGTCGITVFINVGRPVNNPDYGVELVGSGACISGLLL